MFEKEMDGDGTQRKCFGTIGDDHENVADLGKWKENNSGKPNQKITDCCLEGVKRSDAAIWPSNIDATARDVHRPFALSEQPGARAISPRPDSTAGFAGFTRSAPEMSGDTAALFF
jgi:hypothetical protein